MKPGRIRSFVFLSSLCLWLCTVQASCLPQIIRISYNNADYLFLRKLDSYFDIDGKQRAYLKKELALLHRWHRQKELPRYLAFLRHLKARAAKTIGPQDIFWAVRRIQNFRDSFLRRLYRPAMPFLFSLSPEQIDHLKAKLDEDFEELEEKLADGYAEYLKERKEKILERTADWLDGLSARQKQTLAQEIDSIPGMIKKKLRLRRMRQELFISALQTRDNKPERLRSLVKAWTLSYYKTLPLFYKSAFVRSRRQFQAYTLRVSRLATPKQRCYFIDKLSSYENIVQKLLL